MRAIIWTLETVRIGIDKFYKDESRFPTATDFDYCSYLPSARHVQRAFGGFENLRRSLGYDVINYTKGSARTALATTGWLNGLSAEELLEQKLINKFGEAYVHVQKRTYVNMKNRFDFFVYCKGARFGIDIFTTSRARYIDNNVRHKIKKYSAVPSDIDVFFVVDSPGISHKDIVDSSGGNSLLRKHPNLRVVSLNEFLYMMDSYTALVVPAGFVSALPSTAK